MTTEPNKKEENDRKPLEKENDEERLIVRDVLGLEMKPLGWEGIKPEDFKGRRKTKRVRRGLDLI